MKKPKATKKPPTIADSETQRLIHELQVHHVELESQNTELRTTRDELEVALANYTELYDFAPAGYFTLAANGTIALLNLTGATLLGVERSRLIRKAFGGLVIKEQRPLFTAFLKQVFTNEEKQTSDFVIEGKGPPHLVVRIRAQRAANGTECKAVIVDITDRTRAQERLQLLWEGAAVLLATDDIEGMMQGLFAKIGPVLGGTSYLNYMVDESGKALRLDSYAGISDSKARGMARLEFGEALCGTVARHRKPLHVPRVHLSKDPKATIAKELGVRAYCCNPLMAGNVLLGTLSYASRSKDEFEPEELVVMQTLSHYVALAYERLRGAATLRASEVRYRRLFEAAHDGVLILDPDTRKITDANPFMTKLLDYPHAQLVGKELFEIGLLKDEAASQKMFRTLKRKHEVRYEDLPLKSKGGKTHEVEVVANLYQEDGHSVIQCNIRDITARKLALEEQIRMNILATENKKLEAEIVQRKDTESLLKTHKDQLRHLARKLLTVQEEERKRISRELHDVVAQTLTGINVRLASLKADSDSLIPDLLEKIAHTQQMVEQSVDIVHRFARELRPSMLDDLGLVPALESFMKTFIADTGIRVTLTVFKEIEQIDSSQRTVLYRIAQEALTNVSRHSKATSVKIDIKAEKSVIFMEITDDGQGFEVAGTGSAKKNNRLGLLGMRERVEMAGGTFRITSTLGKHTTIRVEVPAASEETIKP